MKIVSCLCNNIRIVHTAGTLAHLTRTLVIVMSLLALTSIVFFSLRNGGF